MKPFAVLLPIAIAAVSHAAAHAGTAASTYVEGVLGVGFQGGLGVHGVDQVLGPFAVDEDLKPGWMASLLVGHRVGDTPLSIEAEGAYLQNDVKSPDLDQAFGAALGVRSRVTGALVNARLQPLRDIAMGSLRAAPYVAAGAGYGRTDISILGDHYPGDGWMWQAKAGVAFAVTPRLSWDLGYRYLRLPSFDTNKLGLAAHFKPDAQVVSVGVRYVLAPFGP